MNYLAHAFLAAPQSEAICGALIGDFAKGVDLAALPEGMRAGVIAHRRIDAFTDAHPVVRAARARFEPPLRRFAGIIVDVAFDHFLAADFLAYSKQPLSAFTASVYAALDAHEHVLPERLRGVKSRMAEQDWLASYAEIENVGRALAGIGRRLRRANPLGDALGAVVANREALARDFEAFFPQLVRAERGEGSGAIG